MKYRIDEPLCDQPQTDFYACVQHWTKIFSRLEHEQIVLSLENSFSFLVCCLSAWMSNKKVIVPASLNHRLNIDSGDNFFIVDDDQFDQQELSKSTYLPQDLDPISLDSQIVFYTSGSTGDPKKITKTFANILSEVRVLEATFGKATDNAKFVSSVPHYHMYGFLFKLFWPFLTKKSLSFSGVKYPEELQNITEPFVFVTTPGFLQRVYFNDSVTFSHCLQVFTSGGALQEEQRAISNKYFAQHPVEIYGSTETGGIGYKSSASRQWQLFDEVELLAQQNETYIQSPFFFEDELHLDDNVTLLSDNKFVLGQRKDRVVKIEEKRTSLTLIENLIQKQSCVEQCKCLTLPVNGRDKVVAVIQLRRENKNLMTNDRLKLTSQIKRVLSQHIDKVFLPKKIRYVERIPTNEMGKITQELLEKLFNDQ